MLITAAATAAIIQLGRSSFGVNAAGGDIILFGSLFLCDSSDNIVVLPQYGQRAIAPLGRSSGAEQPAQIRILAMIYLTIQIGRCILDNKRCSVDVRPPMTY